MLYLIEELASRETDSFKRFFPHFIYASIFAACIFGIHCWNKNHQFSSTCIYDEVERTASNNHDDIIFRLSVYVHAYIRSILYWSSRRRLYYSDDSTIPIVFGSNSLLVQK